MYQFLDHFIIFIESFKYIAIFIGVFFEGPVVMISSGFLFRLGQLQFLPMYLALVFGDFTSDIAWYYVGYFGARPLILKYGKFINVNPEIIEKVEESFKKHDTKILITSKLTMGVGFSAIILAVAGMLRVPMKKYASINLIGGFIWTLFLVVIGFLFGNVYTIFTLPFKIVFVILLATFIILFFRYLKNYFKNKEML